MIKELALATAFTMNLVSGNASINTQWKTNNWVFGTETWNNTNYDGSARTHEAINQIDNGVIEVKQYAFEYTYRSYNEGGTQTYLFLDVLIATKIETKVEEATITVNRSSIITSQDYGNAYSPADGDNYTRNYYDWDGNDNQAALRTILTNIENNWNGVKETYSTIKNIVGNLSAKAQGNSQEDWEAIAQPEEIYLWQQDNDIRWYFEYATLTGGTNLYNEPPILDNCPYQSTIYSTWEAEAATNQEVIDLPGLLFDILGMPFAFISQAFNLTLFPGTNYAIHVGETLFAVIGALLLFIIVKKVILK